MCNRTVLATIGFVALLWGCSGGGGGGSNPTSDVTIALTDAATDELSVLQIELTGVSLTAPSGSAVEVFPTTAGESLSVNLIQLDDVHLLLANESLRAGRYDGVQLEYSNAVAVDREGNTLTVTPASGAVTAFLDPPVSFGARSTFVEIDFDVDNSVTDLVTGAGGSLSLSPTVIVRVEDEDEDEVDEYEIDEFEGAVVAVGDLSLVVSLGRGDVNVELAADTVVDSGDSETTPADEGFDLGAFVRVGDRVEVHGTFTIAGNTVLASKIEVEDGESEESGPGYQGIVTAVSDGEFTVRVTDSRDSGLAAGSEQAVSVNESTHYTYNDPDADATFDNLTKGQEVRVFSEPDELLLARKVRLRKTELVAQVDAVNGELLEATLSVSEVEDLAVAAIPGFPESVVAKFSDAIPAAVTAGATVELEGHFGRSAPGVFDVRSVTPEVEGDDQIEGETFSVLAASPDLRLSITGSLRVGGAVSAATVEVVPAAGAVFLEKDEETSDTLSTTAEAIAAGIASELYERVKAEGVYDESSNTLTADKIVARIPKP